MSNKLYGPEAYTFKIVERDNFEDTQILEDDDECVVVFITPEDKMQEDEYRECLEDLLGTEEKLVQLDDFSFASSLDSKETVQLLKDAGFSL